MTMQLDAVQLNHDPNTVHDNAINIRRNATDTVHLPEWRAGISVAPEDAPAAYLKEETAGHTLTITARFNWQGPGAQTVEVRALDAHLHPPGPSGCFGFFLWLLRPLLRLLFGNVLGEVKAREVTFAGPGLSGFETFQLRCTRLGAVGVGVYENRWRWQFRSEGGAWTDLTTTRHRIYVLLQAPTAPWQQAPSTSTQVPWTEVLDKACHWAEGATTRVQAAAAVTAEVYALGHSVVTYDCPGGGSSHYAYPDFDCSAFLDRLRGGPGNGQYVNCTDCGTFVSVFANALGCDLWASRMGNSFQLNPLLAIGSNVWQTACGWSGFWYHEVAWTDACTASDRVYDACLQVDGDADPQNPPHTPQLPVNMLFGTPGSGGYRDKLSPSGNCDPMPGTRIRRAVS